REAGRWATDFAGRSTRCVSTFARPTFIVGHEQRMNSAARILIADDQTDVLEALRLLLKGEGYRTETVNAPAKTLAAVEGGEFDVVLMDLNYARDTTSGQEGLDLLARLQALDSAMPVVVMTAWANVHHAVKAMPRARRDCVHIPHDKARL